MSTRSLVYAFILLPACGFGVGSFHNKPRSGLFYDHTDSKGDDWYSRESWEDLSGTYNVHLGYKVGATFASAPGRDTAAGRANEVALETRFGRFGLLLGWSEDKATYDDIIVEYQALFIGGRLLLTPPARAMLDLNVVIAQGEACTYEPDDNGCITTGDDLAARAGIGANVYVYASDTMDVFLRAEARVTATEKAPGLADERFTSTTLLTELGFQF